MNIQNIKQTSIVEVAEKLGLEVKGQSGTKLTKCFAHDDKHPSLVLMTNVNRFECKSCGEKGDVIDLVQKVNDFEFKDAVKFIDPTFVIDSQEEVKPQTGKEYLSSHGVNDESIEKFKLVSENNRVIIPTDGGNHYRNLTGEKFTFDSGATVTLFKTKEATKSVILVEGEIDAIVTYQNTNYPVWTSTGGCKTFKQEWVKQFENIDKVYIGYDSDTQGIEGAEEVAKLLGKDRCYKLECPVHDWSVYFKLGYTKEDFDELLKNSKSFNRSLLDRINTTEVQKIATGIKPIDKVLDGGFRLANTYLVAGLEKSGKSSLLLNFVTNILKEKKIAFFNTELPDREFFARLTAIANEVPISEAEANSNLIADFIKKHEDSISYAGIDDLTDTLTKLVSFKKTMELATSFVKKGAKVLFFDNLTTYNTQPDGGKQGWEILANAVSTVVNFSKTNNVLSFIVIHTKPSTTFTETPSFVKKLIDAGQARNIFDESISVIRRPSLMDVYGGGGSLSQLSGALLLWRPYQKMSQSELSQLSSIIFDSFRHSASGKRVDAIFKGERGTFEFIENTFDIAQEIFKTEKSNHEIVYYKDDESENQPIPF